MTKEDPTELIRKAIRIALQAHPEMQAAHTAYLNARAYKDEKNGKGRLTQRAAQARQMLHNPLGVTTAKGKSKKIAQKHAAKAKLAASEKALEFLAALMQEAHCNDTLALFERDDEQDIEPDILPSREEHGQAEIDRMARPFVAGMIERDVSPSAIARMRNFEKDVIAQLVTWAWQDPGFEHPDNLWRVMASAGMLEAYRAGMSEDEARVIATAQLQMVDPEANQLLRDARNLLDRKLEISPQMAAGAARLKRFANTFLAGEISFLEGESTALADSHNLMLETDQRVVGAIANLDPKQTKQIGHLLSYLRHHWTFRDEEKWQYGEAIQRVIAAIDAVDVIEGHPGAWVRDVFAQLDRIAEELKHRISGPQVFFEILQQAMQLSHSGRHAKNWLQQEQSARFEQARKASIDAAIALGLRYKIDYLGWAVDECSERFDETDGSTFIPPNYRCGEMTGASDTDIKMDDQIAETRARLEEMIRLEKHDQMFGDPDLEGDDRTVVSAMSERQHSSELGTAESSLDDENAAPVPDLAQRQENQSHGSAPNQPPDLLLPLDYQREKWDD